VDIEKINPKRNYLRLSSRYFNKIEAQYLEAINKDASQKLFYQLWTAKEAFCKAEGGRLWYYLEKNLLNSDGTVRTQINNYTISLVNDIQNYSLSLASLKPPKNIEMIYE
jgi:phosphopantetheine--protein transferase-like protein